MSENDEIQEAMGHLADAWLATRQSHAPQDSFEDYFDAIQSHIHQDSRFRERFTKGYQLLLQELQK